MFCKPASQPPTRHIDHYTAVDGFTLWHHVFNEKIFFRGYSWSQYLAVQSMHRVDKKIEKQCLMWNRHRNRVVCHLCHNFDNLSLLCPAIGAKRVGFSFHFFGWGHEGGGSRFFCPFCKRWQQYIVTKMTPSCFMYTLSFLLFEEDRCYSDGSVITNFSFYSSRFREQSSLSIFTPSPKLSL